MPMDDEENPLQSLATVVAFSSRDWSANHRDAWIYAIVSGWDDEALAEVAAKHDWDAATVARLCRLRLRFEALAALPTWPPRYE